MKTYPAHIFAGQSYAVVGLGKAGLPAARALMAMGAAVTVWLSSTAMPAPRRVPLCRIRARRWTVCAP